MLPSRVCFQSFFIGRVPPPRAVIFSLRFDLITSLASTAVRGPEEFLTEFSTINTEAYCRLQLGRYL